MRPAAGLAVLALAGCGGGGGAAVSQAPAAPVADQVKYDVRTAAIYLEAHKTTDGEYTDDLSQLPAGFPSDVRIASVNGSGFVVVATAAGGGRYTLTSQLGTESRTCTGCPGGRW